MALLGITYARTSSHPGVPMYIQHRCSVGLWMLWLGNGKRSREEKKGGREEKKERARRDGGRT